MAATSQTGRPFMKSQVAPAPSGAVSLQSTTEKAKSMFGKAHSFFTEGVNGKNGPIIIFILIAVLVFVLVVVYITFALKSSNLKGKQLTSRPIKLDSLSTPFEVSGSDIPKPAVGREYTYSFWVYVDQFQQTPTNGKLLFYRSGTSTDINTANPVVFMDGMENKMYIAIKTQDTSLKGLENGTSKDLSKILQKNYFKEVTSNGVDVNKYIIMEVDYVPLQRWVNIVVIVDNKVVTMFLDGEIYSVKSTEELKSLRKPDVDSSNRPIKYDLIIDNTEGSIFVGKNAINDKVAVNGYLSRLEFYNYAVSLNQVKKIYTQGPLANGGLLSKMGLQYGFRSPVYKLNTSDDKQA